MSNDPRQRDPRYPAPPNPREFSFDRNRGIHVPNAELPEGPRSNDEGHHKKSFGERALPWLTFLVLASQTAIFWKTLDITKQTLPKVGEQAEAATKQATTADRSFEASARAWVVSGDKMSNTCPQAGEKMAIHYFTVNSGARPAVGVSSQTSARVVAADPSYVFPESPPYDDPKLIALFQQPSISVIGPRQKMYDTVYTHEPLTADQLRGLVAPRPQYTLFVYGKITYEDGFGKKRYTHWCRRWQPEGSCGVSRFVWCGTYNAVGDS